MFFTLTKPVSKDFSLIAAFAQENQYTFIHNHPIFHRHDTLLIKALLFLPRHGIVVFDTLDWSLDELRHASAKSAETTQKRRNKPATIDVDETHQFILNKFNEILHHDGAPIVNFVVLNDISQASYVELDASIKALLPAERLVFSDDTPKEIAKKFNESLQFNGNLPETNELLSALFIDYLVFRSHHPFTIISAQQESILQSTLHSQTQIIGASGSGKSTILFNKLLHEKLRAPNDVMVLIAATQVACDIYKQMLLDAIEYAIVDIDFSTLFILTPEQFTARYHAKTLSLFKKDALKKTTTLFCDDASYLDAAFLRFIQSLQKRLSIVLALEETNHDVCERFELTHSYRQLRENDYRVTHGNLFMHTLLILQTLLKRFSSEQILIITPDLEITQSLQSEVKDFFGTLSAQMDADQGIADADFSKLIICEIDEIHHIERDALIFIDAISIPEHLRTLAMSKARVRLDTIKDPSLYEEISSEPSE